MNQNMCVTQIGFQVYKTWETILWVKYRETEEDGI